MTLKVINRGNEHILYDEALVSQAEIANWFNLSEQTELGEGTGRVAPQFFSKAGQKYVLKRYARGGLPRFFIRDRYCRFGNSKVRSFAECRMLYALHLQGLPVPVPVAAYSRHRSWYYTCALITLSCHPARPLSRILLERDCDESEWHKIIEMIDRFHEAGLCHADLNAHNILLDESDGKTILLDFDKAVLKYQSGKWRRRNLQRLQRSLLKLKRLNPGFHFDEKKIDLPSKKLGQRSDGKQDSNEHRGV